MAAATPPGFDFSSKATDLLAQGSVVGQEVLLLLAQGGDFGVDVDFSLSNSIAEHTNGSLNAIASFINGYGDAVAGCFEISAGLRNGIARAGNCAQIGPVNSELVILKSRKTTHF